MSSGCTERLKASMVPPKLSSSSPKSSWSRRRSGGRRSPGPRRRHRRRRRRRRGATRGGRSRRRGRTERSAAGRRRRSQVLLMPAHARSAAHGHRGTRSGCHTRGRGAAERRNLRAGWGRPARRAGGPRRPPPPPTAGRRAAGRPARGTRRDTSRLPSSTSARNAAHGSHRRRRPRRGRADVASRGGGDEDRAHLVLDDAVLLGAVAEARAAPAAGRSTVDAELLLDAAAYGVRDRLAGRRVAAARCWSTRRGTSRLCSARWVTSTRPASSKT